MESQKKDPGKRRVTFKKDDFEKFAAKLEKFGSTLSPEERGLLLAVLDKGSKTIRTAGDSTVHTTTTISVDMVAREFDLGQFIVELLLALKGVSVEVDEDGPSFVQEIDWAKT